MAMRMPHDGEGNTAVATPGDATGTGAGTGLLPIEAIVEHVVLVGHRGVRLTPARTNVTCGCCNRALARVTDEMGTSTLGARYRLTLDGLRACPGIAS